MIEIFEDCINFADIDVDFVINVMFIIDVLFVINIDFNDVVKFDVNNINDIKEIKIIFKFFKNN